MAACVLLPSNRKLRHERVQTAKQARDDTLTPLREHLHQLDPTIRPQSALVARESVADMSRSAHAVLPVIKKQVSSSKRGSNSTRSRKSTPPNYRDVMEAIRKLQRERKSLPDPYMGNLKVCESVFMSYL